MEKIISTFYQLLWVQSSSNFQFDFEWGKWCLHLFSITMNSVFIKLTGIKNRHKILYHFEFQSYLTSHFGVTCPWALKKKWCLQLFSVILIGSLSNLQVTRTCIKAWTSSNLGQIRLFTLELFALEHRFFSHSLIMEKIVSPLFISYYEFSLYQTFNLTLNGENGVSIFSQLLWIQSSSNLQVTRTGIKSWTSLNFGRIWPVIFELHVLEL